MKVVEVKKPDQSQQQNPKHYKKVSLESDSEEDEFTVSETQSVKKELQNYMDEPKLGENSDPLLDFWKHRKFHYPRLSILAKKYLTVQATSTPSERVFSKQTW